MKFIRQIYDWMMTKVESPYADVWLAALFFVEASFFIIPVDPLLIMYCIAHRNRAFHYAAIATIASVVGGLFGYMIGALLWHSIGSFIVQWLISEKTFYAVVAKYAQYQHWAVLIAGFTPVPYKAVTISAGFCKLSLVPFIVYSAIARGARFFLVAGTIRLWGPQIQACIDRYFNYLVVAFMLIVAVSVWALV